MAVREEIVIPSLIENTTMIKLYRDEVFIAYKFRPIDGYVLHDKAYDYYGNFDDEGNPIGEPIELGYATGTCSCPASYDFTINPREFYTILESDVPETGVIFGGDKKQNRLPRHSLKPL